MKIRPACEEELLAIERLYTAVIDGMRGTPCDILWEMGVHPSRESLRAALRAGELLGAFDADGSPLGALVLNGSQADDYRLVPCRVEAPDDAVAVVHLLAVDPAARGRGIGRSLLRVATDAAAAAGKLALRLDVFDNNAPARALYVSCGFADLGVRTINVGDGYVHAVNLMELDLRNLPASEAER